MKKITELILISVFSVAFFSVMYSGAYAQDSSKDVSVTREEVLNKLAELASSREYVYTEHALEEPIWIQWVKEHLKRFFERRREGWFSLKELLSFRVLSWVIAFLVLCGAVVWLVKFYLHRLGSRIGAAGSLEKSGEPGYGVWGETGACLAMDLASQGRFREAVSQLFRSLLKGLDNLGWIVYQQGRASRAYLRQLRKSEKLYPLFRDFLWRFELAYYRQDSPTPDDWGYLYDRYVKTAQAASEEATRGGLGRR